MPASHWLQLSLTNGIGPILIRRMIDLAGSAENATHLTRKDLERIEGIGTAKATAIAQRAPGTLHSRCATSEWPKAQRNNELSNNYANRRSREWREE